MAGQEHIGRRRLGTLAKPPTQPPSRPQPQGVHMFQAIYGIEPTRPSIKQRLRRLLHRYWYRSLSNTSWSQFGEDRYLHQLFKAKGKGFYVDIGAFDPEKFSNTKALHQRGWHGINVDMSPSKIGIFEKERPNDTNVIAPISDTNDQIDVYLFSQRPIIDTLSSALDTLSIEQAEKWSAQFNLQYETKTMQAIRLDDLFEKVNAPKTIDLLNIDVEGAEMNVLRSISLDRYDVEVIAIEIHADFDGLTQSEPYRHLAEQGYILRGWLHPTAIMSKKRADE